MHMHTLRLHDRWLTFVSDTILLCFEVTRVKLISLDVKQITLIKDTQRDEMSDIHASKHPWHDFIQASTFKWR